MRTAFIGALATELPVVEGEVRAAEAVAAGLTAELEAELDEALATARSSTSGPAEALADGVDEDAYLVDEGGDASDADDALAED